MATSDLLNELSKDTFAVDPELEKKLCGVVAVQLEDQSGDISGLAVKWCAAMVRLTLDSMHYIKNTTQMKNGLVLLSKYIHRWTVKAFSWTWKACRGYLSVLALTKCLHMRLQHLLQHGVYCSQNWMCYADASLVLLCITCCSLGVLIRKVGEPRALNLIRGLCEKLIQTAKKDQSRDIASIGLKTVIEVTSGSLAHPAAAVITSKMLDGVQQKVQCCWQKPSSLVMGRNMHLSTKFYRMNQSLAAFQFVAS
jgi:hypothetical protein